MIASYEVNWKKIFSVAVCQLARQNCFKIVLKGKKNQNVYISCSAVCPFKSGKNIFFVKLFDFWVILSGEFSIGISLSQAYLDYISYSHVRQMVSVSISVSTFKNKPSN